MNMWLKSVIKRGLSWWVVMQSPPLFNLLANLHLKTLCVRLILFGEYQIFIIPSFPCVEIEKIVSFANQLSPKWMKHYVIDLVDQIKESKFLTLINLLFDYPFAG